VRFKVLTAMKRSMLVLWVVTPYDAASEEHNVPNCSPDGICTQHHTALQPWRPTSTRLRSGQRGNNSPHHVQISDPASTLVRNATRTVPAQADIADSSIKDITVYKLRNKTTSPHSNFFFSPALQLKTTWLRPIVEILDTIRWSVQHHVMTRINK
jgi:hypothetical protein